MVDPNINDLLLAVTHRAVAILEMCSRQDHLSSSVALSELRPLIRGRQLLAVLEDVSSARSVVVRFGDGLYVTGDERDSIGAAAEKAMAFVASRTACRRPIVIMRIGGREPLAHVVQEIDGISLVYMSPADARDADALLHELAHTFAMADHRILDEGWADWMAAFFESDGNVDLVRMRESASGAPTADALLARRWRQYPAFEVLGESTRKAVRAASTLLVAELVSRIGEDGFCNLAASVRDCAEEDCRRLLVDLCGPILTLWDATPEDIARPDANAFDDVHRAFILGDSGVINGYLPRFAEASALASEDLALSAANLMLLLLAASDPVASDTRLALSGTVGAFVRRHGDIPMSYALCLSLEGIKVAFAPNFVALGDAFSRGRAIMAVALDRFPEDLDVLIAAAKFEGRTPEQHGGSKAVACGLLKRAAAVAPWQDVARRLERAAKPSAEGSVVHGLR